MIRENYVWWDPRGWILIFLAISLLVALSSRVPDFARAGTNWDQSNPLKAKTKFQGNDWHLETAAGADFSRLLPVLPHSVATPGERPVLPALPGESLYNRPPPPA